MSEVIKAAILQGHTLPGLKHALFTYLLTTGHLDPKWNNAIAYPPRILGAAQRSTCVIFVFFCRVWSERLPENVTVTDVPGCKERSTISDSTEGLLDGDLLDEAGIQLE
ncbi:hypothetical protein F5146DRAFT_1004272 [Armillaria mellea]|nr:hypothetical protein F5146DRAFT_1004272 [Armillaria mellea]